jgi:hypothetical protein
LIQISMEHTVARDELCSNSAPPHTPLPELV